MTLPIPTDSGPVSADGTLGAVPIAGKELLHLRVARRIADDIASGALQAGDRLPPERDLSEQFGVSRATIRRAFAELTEAGLIESHTGRGSFVIGAPLEEAPNELISFTELGASRGLTATAEVLGTHVEPATIEEAETLGIAPGADVFVLRRLRRLESLAISVDTNRIPLGRAPSLSRVDFTDASLYEALDRDGVRPMRADYTVRAVAAPPDLAKLLGVDVGAPLLHAATIGYLGDGEVIELADMHYRGDRYRFHATLLARGATAQPASTPISLRRVAGSDGAGGGRP